MIRDNQAEPGAPNVEMPQLQHTALSRFRGCTTETNKQHKDKTSYLAGGGGVGGGLLIKGSHYYRLLCSAIPIQEHACA